MVCSRPGAEAALSPRGHLGPWGLPRASQVGVVTLLDYQEGRWPYFWASTFRIYVNQPHRTPHSDSCQRGSLQPSAVQFYQMSQRGASDFRQDSWREAGLPGLRLVCAFPGSIMFCSPQPEGVWMRCFSRSPLMASSVNWATGVPAARREDGTQVWGCPQHFQALTSQGPRGQGQLGACQ